MVQNNTENVLEAHFPSIKRTHTVLEFGTPIDTAALDRDERKALPDTVHDLMLQIYEKNKSLV
jgi:1-acyl-sn-glycerol-3-phosphate acyltransferase